MSTPAPAELEAELDRQWTALGRPGTWLDGRERVALVEVARGQRAPEPPDAPAVAAGRGPGVATG